MGSFLSKAKKPNEWRWTGPPGDHSPFPKDPVPYPGYQVKYCFLDVMAKFRVMEERVNLGPTAVTTNVEEFMDDFKLCYEQGYRLDSFIRVPGLKTAVEVVDWSDKIPFQAIFSKPNKTSENNDAIELVLAKKILSTKFMEIDCFDEKDSMLVGIKKYAEMGGRLVCVEPVGYMKSNTENYHIGAIGVELFFNMPMMTQGKPVQKYSYHALKLPARYHVYLDPTQTIQQIDCETDFNAQMREFLEKGWKLVDICMDTVALAEAFRMRTRIRYIDTMWIFEKECESLDDETPRYEGVVIEYLHKVKNTFTGDYPCNDWRPIIAAMGVMGWQIVTILQTPVIIQTTFTNYTIKVIMIFQRKLIPAFSYMRKLRADTDFGKQPKSEYQGMRTVGEFYEASGEDQTTSGYYNNFLKKYIYNPSNHCGYLQENTTIESFACFRDNVLTSCVHEKSIAGKKASGNEELRLKRFS